MNFKIIKQFFNIDRIILILSLAYIGLFFAGSVDYVLWILFTLALLCAKLAHSSFQYLLKDNSKFLTLKGLFQEDKGNPAALLYGVVSSALFIFLSFVINDICYYISIAAVILIIGFPLLKRYSSMPGYYFGIFEAMCPVGGYIAANNRFETIPFILVAFVIFWIAGVRIAGSVFEMRKDKKSENYVVNKIGYGKAQALSVVFFIFSIIIMVFAGFLENRGMAYWISLFCMAIIIMRQEVLVKSRDIDSAKIEFFQINNFTAPLLLIGLLIDIFYK